MSRASLKSFAEGKTVKLLFAMVPFAVGLADVGTDLATCLTY